MKYSDKIKHDIGAKTVATPAESAKAVSVVTDKIWSLFITTVEGLKKIFPLRNFSMILLDEFNDFRFLSAFIKPIRAESDGIERLDDLAKAVAAIPFEPTVLAPQWGTELILSDLSDKSESSRLAQWLTMGKPGQFATETFVGQIASPSTILVRRRASLIEHAILLCSLFRGQHVNAYVAIGEGLDQFND